MFFNIKWPRTFGEIIINKWQKKRKEKKPIKWIKSHINYILFIMVETTNILNKVPICDMDV
jgi:hypothetical protein